MKEKILAPSLPANTTTGDTVEGVGAARQLEGFLEKCGRFAAYTTTKMKELLFTCGGKLRVVGS
jgi:hypothetical protein